MPIRVPASIRFPSDGTNGPLDREIVAELLALARRIQSDRGYKRTIETFNRHLSRSSGQGSTASSSADWAETDLLGIAEHAAEDAPAFIAGFCDACEELAAAGSAVPNHSVVNAILFNYGSRYCIEEGELVDSAPSVVNVEAPKPPVRPDQAVARALADATALVGHSGAASAIDRAHTALHGYMRQLCEEAGIETAPDAATPRLFRELRRRHPALRPREPRAEDITRFLQAMATALDSLSPIRNKASLAHANRLLEEPEAFGALNAARTIFRYIQDCIARHTARPSD